MFLDYDNFTQTKKNFFKDAGKCVIESVQDVEPFIEHNKRLAEQLNKKEDWWYVGSIPNVVLLEWAKESNTTLYSQEWHKYAIKQLNKSEYRKFNVNRIKL